MAIELGSYEFLHAVITKKPNPIASGVYYDVEVFAVTSCSYEWGEKVREASRRKISSLQLTATQGAGNSKAKKHIHNHLAGIGAGVNEECGRIVSLDITRQNLEEPSTRQAL